VVIDEDTVRSQAAPTFVQRAATRAPRPRRAAS
jgi:hypothetical protein